MPLEAPPSPAYCGSEKKKNERAVQGQSLVSRMTDADRQTLREAVEGREGFRIIV